MVTVVSTSTVSMQDYMDSTSNVIEGALSTDALTGNKTYYTSVRRCVCKLLLLTCGLLISTLDVSTDWFNYVHATRRILGELGRTGDTDATLPFLSVYLGICILGSLAWLATFCVLCLQFYVILRRQKRSGRLEFLEEMASMATLVLQDAPMVTLLTISISLRFCPLVEQMRTTPGKTALLSTGLSIIFRMVHSLAFCCSCRKKKDGERVTRVCVIIFTVILRLLRTLVLALAAVLFMFTVVIAFTPNPNTLHWLRLLQKGLDFSGIPNGPIYIYQKYDLPYTIRRLVDADKTNQVLPPADNFEKWSHQKGLGIPQVDYTCDHYVRRLHLGDSLDLVNAGPVGLSRTYPCEVANPFLKTSLPEEIQPLVHNHTCTITFSIVYNEETVSLKLTTDVTLEAKGNITSVPTKKTSEGCSRVKFDSSMYTNHTAPVIGGWPSQVITALKDYECKHSYECHTILPPLFDPHLQPYFSCLSDVCDVKPRPAARDGDIRRALHRFTYFSYQLVLPTAKSYFPCLVSVSAESQLNVGDCDVKNSQVNLQDTLGNFQDSEVLSCPESPFPNHS